MRTYKRKTNIWQTAIIWIFALLMLLPFAQICWTAQKTRARVDQSWYYLAQRMPEQEIAKKIEIDPRPLRVALMNSLIVSTLCSVLGVCLSLFAGYAFAKKRFPGKTLLFDIIVVSMAVPPAILMMPLFRISVMLHIYDTLAALVIPSAVTGFGVFYMRMVLSTVPDSVINAARLDGLSESKLLLRIIVPIAWPALLTLGVMQFILTWNSFVIPHALIASPSNYTVSILLGRLLPDYRGLMWNDIMVVVGAAIVPIVIIFLLFQRLLISNLSDVEDNIE